jgi:DNA-binding transcriptional MocR family regulator
MTALASQMPEDVSWIEPAGGNTVWLTLPAGVDAARLLAESRNRGIAYTPGAAFFFDGNGIDGNGARHLLLSFARVPAEAMEAGVGELASLLGRCRMPLKRSA